MHPGQVTCVPHRPQKPSPGSSTAPHFGHAYSIRVPHLPQNASSGANGAPHWGQPPSAGGGFAAHSRQRITGVPLRRTGFHAGVRLPQSAQVRSFAWDASMRRSSGREGAASAGGGFSGGRALSGGSAIRHATATTA